MYTTDVRMWPDEKLLELIQEDDSAAFECIYTRYWSKLYLSAYNMIRDGQACEDIVQGVLVSLWMRRNSLEVGSLNAFLYASVRYQVFKAIRAGKVRADLLGEPETLTVENEGVDRLTEKDIDRLLNQGIAVLPEKCRQIFILSRKEHLSTKEIALRLGIAPKTVENQLTIALHRLRTTFGDAMLSISAFLTGWWF